MAKKKKKNTTSWSPLSFFRKDKKKTRRKKKKVDHGISFKWVLRISALIVFLAAVGWSGWYLEKYVKTGVFAASVSKDNPGDFRLVGEPEWASAELKNRIFDTARKVAAGAEKIALDENAARRVYDNLTGLEWLYNIRVQTTHSEIQIAADYRRPVAMIDHHGRKMYLSVDDSGRVIPLSYVAVPQLVIPEIRNYTAAETPVPGKGWSQSDIESGVELVRLLQYVEKLEEKKTGKHLKLLSEISYIDLANFDGRSSTRKPHIVLMLTDGTPVYWGAAPRQASKYHEPDDSKKLLALYNSYSDGGTLLNRVKFYDLVNMQAGTDTPQTMEE